jgi:hypothetical protein
MVSVGRGDAFERNYAKKVKMADKEMSKEWENVKKGRLGKHRKNMKI